MEGLAAHSMDSDLKASSAQRASNGQNPKAWKKYIDSVKVKIQSWDEYRQNRMITYLYVSAFKVIPDTDTSFSHAHLLIDYAEFTRRHDMNEAVKILVYGRRILPHYSIIHVASAELELQRGQREEAVSILQKAMSLETEPVSDVIRALQRLNEGKTDLRDCTNAGHTQDETHSGVLKVTGHTQDETHSGVLKVTGHTQDETHSGILKVTGHTQDETHSGVLKDISNRQCEFEVSSFKSVKPDMPTTSAAAGQISMPNCPSVVQDKGDSSGVFTNPSCELPRVVDQMIIGDSCQRSDISAVLKVQLAPRQGPSRKLQLPYSETTTRFVTEMSGPITQLSNGTWPVYSSTPLSLRRDNHFEVRAESTRELLGKQQEMQQPQQGEGTNRTFSIHDSVSAMYSAMTPAKTHIVQSSNSFLGDCITPCASVELAPKRGSQNGGRDSSGEFNSSQLSATLRKFRPLNLGPPRRVKVIPAVKNLSDEEEEEMIAADVEPHPQSVTGHLEQAHIQMASSATTSTTEQAPEEARPGTLGETCGTRSGSSLLKSDLLTSLPVTTAPRIHGTARLPVAAQNESESTSNLSHLPCEAPRPADQMITGDSCQRSDISAVLRTQPASRQGPSRKLQLPSYDGTNRLTAELSGPVGRLSSEVHPVYSSTPLSIRPNDHQQVRVESTKEILVKQQEIIQQLLQQQQQQQQSGVNNRTVSVHNSQSAVVSGITSTKSHTQTEDKTIVVNGKPYTVMYLVGRGGSAKVYKVYDRDSRSNLAVKCVNLSCANQAIVEGYKNEILLLKKLQHCRPVIKLHDYEYMEASKKLFVVLEFGETDLCKFISQNENEKCLHPINIRYFFLQMVSAVHAMHKEGVIHSDLKPANFILVSGEVKLIDFGIANSLQQDNTSIVKENLVGTPSFMSPEALMSVSPYTDDSKPKYKVGVRSDVWSLGCILYQMVYGHTPFQHVRHKMEAIVNPAHEIPFPDKGDPELMDILKKCLTRNIAERPTTSELLNHPYLRR